MKSFIKAAGRYESLIWTVIILVVLAVQWPALKGWYYKAAGSEAPGNAIAWRTDLQGALAESRATGKPVFVDFSADWCPPCIAMKHDVWPDARVQQALNTGYIPLLIDVDQDAVASAMYDVESIPTILVLDQDGTVLRRASFLPLSGMLRFLDEAE